ncbi:MAG: hypothetical protein LBS38_01920 [Endomicrobium sp.]|jgi:hypothetical protein|nr:hypothetical protein [Endomicrobium sp.]MDR2398846.1 hypothetical protein [Endomicrobium sp.]
MKKLFILCVLFLICFSKSNALESPDLRLIKLNRKAIKVDDSKGNKLLGYVNFQRTDL